MSTNNLITYNVDSIFRSDPNNYDTDNFVYNFYIPPDLYDRITHVSITQVSIPRSWYIVQSFPLNSFTLYEDGVPIPFTIPIGNYTNIQLFQTLELALNLITLNAITYTVTEVNSPTLGVAPVPDVGLIRIQSSNPAVVSSLYFSPQTFLDIIFGFNEGQNTFNSFGTLTSGVYNLNPESTILMTSSCVKSNINDNPVSNQTLCNISVNNVPPFSYICQQYSMLDNRKIFNKISTSFKISLENNIGIKSFFLNNINIDFVINFFEYVANKPFYEKATELLAIIAQEV